MVIEQIKNVRVNLEHLSVRGVERICSTFHERYTTEVSNNFFLINLQEISYDEFCQLVGIYAYFINFGKLHIIHNPPYPRTDVMITSRSN